MTEKEYQYWKEWLNRNEKEIIEELSEYLD